MRAIVTGGAGFIGSHLVDLLLERGHDVKVIDNLKTGRIENIEEHLEKNQTVFVNADLIEREKVLKEIKEQDVVFHFAADPEVRISRKAPSSHFENNVLATMNVLEALRVNEINDLVFASSSTVYGDAEILPTPENYSPMKPISTYGASKLACEALISGYAHTFCIRSLVLRPANIIGSRVTHGVILDFINKLEADPNRLEILGDGTQKKSYLHVSDFVDAVLKSYSHFKSNPSKLEIYNVGNTDSTTVREIAKMVADEMALRDVRFTLTGGVEGGRGWKGDVKTMLLDIKKLEGIGWKHPLNSNQAVRLAIREILGVER